MKHFICTDWLIGFVCYLVDSGVEWGHFVQFWSIRMIYTRWWSWNLRREARRNRSPRSHTGDFVTLCFIKFLEVSLSLFSSSTRIFVMQWVNYWFPVFRWSVHFLEGIFAHSVFLFRLHLAFIDFRCRFSVLNFLFR